MKMPSLAQFGSDQKMSEKEVALILRGPCFPTILDTSNIERATAFPSFLHRQSKKSWKCFWHHLTTTTKTLASPYFCFGILILSFGGTSVLFSLALADTVQTVQFPLTPMGVLTHRLRTLDRSLIPHQHERKFAGARVCRVTFKHLPQPLRSHI
jgi:hypothetical protein